MSVSPAPANVVPMMREGGPAAAGEEGMAALRFSTGKCESAPIAWGYPDLRAWGDDCRPEDQQNLTRADKPKHSRTLGDMCQHWNSGPLGCSVERSLFSRY